MNVGVPGKPELLAPAGQLESAYAAFAFGADAVYAGLSRFSARAEAANFTPESLEELVAYAHSLNPARRVYVALNTLVREDEWKDALEAIHLCADLGVDALIVQDLGVCRLARRHVPKLKLHASTQMALHDSSGVDAARELGFSRVTLARELTLDEIRATALVPGIQVETFVHGALCYSYSGLCLYSSLVLGRSGNRGRCAYLCRDGFKLKTLSGHDGEAGSESGFFFSMKDLMLADSVEDLARAGVSALKIEGRMKSPLYVAAVVNFYRKLIDGSFKPGERAEAEADIKLIFSRPWTSLYLSGRRNSGVVEKGLQGHRGIPVGRVESTRVVSRQGTVSIRFQSSRPLERHDGLQIDLPGQDRPFAFPVDVLRVCRTGERRPVSVFEAPAGAIVEVDLPPGHPAIPIGCVINLVSSQAVKRKYVFDRPKPGLFRIKQPLNVIVKWSATEAVAFARPAQGNAEWQAEARMDGTFAKAREAGKIALAAKSAFEKLGGTKFGLAELDIKNPEHVFVPISLLNELRRRLVNAADAFSAQARQHRMEGAIALEQAEHAACATRVVSNSPVKWSLKLRSAADVSCFAESDWHGVGDVTLEVGRRSFEALIKEIEMLGEMVGNKSIIRLALPLIVRSWDEPALMAVVKRLLEAGFQRWEVSGLAGLRRLRGMATDLNKELDIAADWPLYALNKHAIRMLCELGMSRITLSPEDGLENIRVLAREAGGSLAFLVFQDTPLFISATCPKTGGSSGKCTCPEELGFVSSHNDELLATMRDCLVSVTSERALCRPESVAELSVAGIGWMRADFSWRPRTPSDVCQTWRDVRGGLAMPGAYAGNLYRGMT